VLLIRLESKIIWGYWLAFFVLVTIGIFSWQNSRELESSDFAVNHTNKVLRELTELKVRCLVMESAARGFIISENQTFRIAVETGESSLIGVLLELRFLLKGNPAQVQRLNTLEMEISSLAKILRTSVSISRIQGFEAAKAYFLNSEAPRYMTEIFHDIKLMDELERQLLREREYLRNEVITSFNWVYISLLSSIFIVMLILYNNIIRNLRAEGRD
jgi:CHASE3 domain sensor protein